MRQPHSCPSEGLGFHTEQHNSFPHCTFYTLHICSCWETDPCQAPEVYKLPPPAHWSSFFSSNYYNQTPRHIHSNFCHTVECYEGK